MLLEGIRVLALAFGSKGPYADKVGFDTVAQGNRSYYAAPADTYQTRDGWIVVSVVGNPVFERWATLVQRPDLLGHPQLQDDQARAENVQLIDEVMRPWCKARSCKEAMADLDETRISCGELYDLPAVRDDPQVKSQGLLKPLHYPGTREPIPIADTPVRLSHSPASIRSAPPTLGQDTDAILMSLGYNQSALCELQEKRVI